MNLSVLYTVRDSFACLFVLSAVRWRRHVAPKRRLTLNSRYDIIAQKMEHFIATAWKTSSPTIFYVNTAEIMAQAESKRKDSSLLCIAE
jgi:hypothetical protein